MVEKKIIHIAFEIEAFKKWLERIGCDSCQYFPTLEKHTIVHKWESNINSVITKHKDVELIGEIWVEKKGIDAIKEAIEDERRDKKE